MNIHELIERMVSCEQAPGHSTLDHGIAVLLNMHDLVDGMPRGPVPPWYIEHHRAIVDSMFPISIWGPYAIYHDCGKWKVRTVDENGRQHFPDHARASADLWLSITGINDARQNMNRPRISDLMRLDMAMHTYTAAQIQSSVIMRHVDFSATLLISALAELHANAPMFGGFESDSFKIKYKQVKRRGSQVCRRWWPS